MVRGALKREEWRSLVNRHQPCLGLVGNARPKLDFTARKQHFPNEPFIGIFCRKVTIGEGRDDRQINPPPFQRNSGCPPSCKRSIRHVGGWSLEADKLSGGLVSQAVQEDVSQAVFYTLRSLPFSEISLVVAVVLAGIFLVTTCAAGILILSVISTGDEKHGWM